MQTSNVRGRKATTVRDDSSKTFVCPVAGCNSAFRRSEHLRRHNISVHTDTKNHQCPDCGSKFSRKDNLDQHRQNLHIPAASKTKKTRATQQQALPVVAPVGARTSIKIPSTRSSVPASTVGSRTSTRLARKGGKAPVYVDTMEEDEENEQSVGKDSKKRKRSSTEEGDKQSLKRTKTKKDSEQIPRVDTPMLDNMLVAVSKGLDDDSDDDGEEEMMGVVKGVVEAVSLPLTAEDYEAAAILASMKKGRW